MNMQFYDHSGETHVRTRASYVPRPGRTSPGLIREESYEHTETSAKSPGVSCTPYIPRFLCHERKILKFISLRVVASAVRSFIRFIKLIYVLFAAAIANIGEFGGP